MDPVFLLVCLSTEQLAFICRWHHHNLSLSCRVCVSAETQKLFSLNSTVYCVMPACRSCFFSNILLLFFCPCVSFVFLSPEFLMFFYLCWNRKNVAWSSYVGWIEINFCVCLRRTLIQWWLISRLLNVIDKVNKESSDKLFMINDNGQSYL